ncbi:MAG: DNA mismatch repair endonuclease MutL, partial [Lachnospiraceae bacterium]|nr:DNA mismatch repair endonuclease MutL [Lachnospiraceae bacterium]
MAIINILDQGTINQIAAGEVVDRPSSIVKELVENAMDAGADAITVEIKDGGIALIRVTDNGCGIEKSEVRKAFLRHATSKIASAEDLNSLHSLGFRGEALSSIAAVSQVELITKTAEEMIGTRVTMEGPTETDFEEVGAPTGTTILVRNIFFNVPARKKFLKSPQTEGSYIAELMEHLALSHPNISFQFIQNHQLKFSTSGNGKLKEVIYRIYGKEVVDDLIDISQEGNGITVRGYLSKPSGNRSNRNFEQYFINGRYIKSKVIASAIEDGYHLYLMQHKYPFVILMIDVDPTKVDVNVHPSKMEVRFDNNQYIHDFLESSIAACLHVHEMIPNMILEAEGRSGIDFSERPQPFQSNVREASSFYEKGAAGESAAQSAAKPLGMETLFSD